MPPAEAHEPVPSAVAGAGGVPTPLAGTQTAMAEVRPGYFAVAFLDRQVGRILAELERPVSRTTLGAGPEMRLLKILVAGGSQPVRIV